MAQNLIKYQIIYYIYIESLLSLRKENILKSLEESEGVTAGSSNSKHEADDEYAAFQVKHLTLLTSSKIYT